MKRCQGCGALLQIEDKTKSGYVRSLEMDLCERCFRIRHYNDLTIDMRRAIDNKEILNKVRTTSGTIVLIIDILAIEATFTEDLIETLKGRSVIVIFNKLDILPYNTDIDRYIDYLKETVSSRLKEVRIIDVILAHKYDKGFKDVFMDVIKGSAIKELVFIGYYNAGKSTIINRLLERDLVVTSYFPSTTLDFNEIDLGDIKLIDTPGLIYEYHLAQDVSKEELKKIEIAKTIKPKVYQFYSKQTYLIDDLCYISLYPKADKASVIFYLSERLEILRIKSENLDPYLQRHDLRLRNADIQEYDLEDKDAEFVVCGLGVIATKGAKSLKIATAYKTTIYKRKCVF